MLFVYQVFLIIKLWLTKKMTEQHEIVALIPVREGSERVKGKNFIPFCEGKSLLEIKINTLKEADCFDLPHLETPYSKEVQCCSWIKSWNNQS